MEAQLHHPQDTGLHLGEGHGQVHDEGDQHHHEKISVLKKVKAKARKIKDTLKHGIVHDHEHEHEHEHRSHEGEEEEETDEDEEMEEAAEVHGGPYVIRSKDVPKEEVGAMVNLENPSSGREDRYAGNKMKDEEVQRPVLEKQDEFPRHTPPFAETHVTDHGLQGHFTSLENREAPEYNEDIMHRPVAPSGTQHEHEGQQGHDIGAPTSIQEDPNAPKHTLRNLTASNYQSKEIDPTGANREEAGVDPLVQSLKNMGVKDTPETTQGTGDSLYTGTHDQFTPEEAPATFPAVHEDTETFPKSMEELPRDTPTGKQGSYTEKISLATSAIADKAVAAKNAVASKLGYGGTEETPARGRDKDATQTTSAAGLAQKAASTVAEKLAPVYEKVAGDGSTVRTRTSDKGVSMKEYLVEKFKPGDEDKALSEVISGSLSRQKERTGETKPMGEVTVSEEVVRRLGPIEVGKKDGGGGGDGDGDGDGSSLGETQGEGYGQGVVDRLKGALGSWLGHTSPDSTADGGGAVVGRRGS